MKSIPRVGASEQDEAQRLTYEALRLLSSDRAAAAANPHIPRAEFVVLLKQHPLEALQNPTLSLWILEDPQWWRETLYASWPSMIRQMAEYRFVSEEMIQRYSTDCMAHAGTRLASYPSAVQWVQRLLNDSTAMLAGQGSRDALVRTWRQFRATGEKAKAERRLGMPSQLFALLEASLEHWMRLMLPPIGDERFSATSELEYQLRGLVHMRGGISASLGEDRAEARYDEVLWQYNRWMEYMDSRTRPDQVGAKRPNRARDDVSLPASELRELAKSQPLSVLRNLNVPPDLFAQLAVRYPVQAITSPSIKLLLVENPTLWEEIERAGAHTWLSKLSELTPSERVRYRADVAQDVLDHSGLIDATERRLIEESIAYDRRALAVPAVDIDLLTEAKDQHRRHAERQSKGSYFNAVLQAQPAMRGWAQSFIHSMQQFVLPSLLGGWSDEQRDALLARPLIQILVTRQGTRVSGIEEDLQMSPEAIAQLALRNPREAARHPNIAPNTLRTLLYRYPLEATQNPALSLFLLEDPSWRHLIAGYVAEWLEIMEWDTEGASLYPDRATEQRYDQGRADLLLEFKRRALPFVGGMAKNPIVKKLIAYVNGAPDDISFRDRTAIQAQMADYGSADIPQAERMAVMCLATDRLDFCVKHLAALHSPSFKLNTAESDSIFLWCWNRVLQVIYGADRQYIGGKKIIDLANATQRQIADLAKRDPKTAVRHPNISKELFAQLIGNHPLEGLQNPALRLWALEDPRWVEHLEKLHAARWLHLLLPTLSASQIAAYRPLALARYAYIYQGEYGNDPLFDEYLAKLRVEADNPASATLPAHQDIRLRLRAVLAENPSRAVSHLIQAALNEDLFTAVLRDLHLAFVETISAGGPIAHDPRQEYGRIYSKGDLLFRSEEAFALWRLLAPILLPESTGAVGARRFTSIEKDLMASPEEIERLAKKDPKKALAHPAISPESAAFQQNVVMYPVAVMSNPSFPLWLTEDSFLQRWQDLESKHFSDWLKDLCEALSDEGRIKYLQYLLSKVEPLLEEYYLVWLKDEHTAPVARTQASWPVRALEAARDILRDLRHRIEHRSMVEPAPSDLMRQFYACDGYISKPSGTTHGYDLVNALGAAIHQINWRELSHSVARLMQEKEYRDSDEEALRVLRGQYFKISPEWRDKISQDFDRHLWDLYQYAKGLFLRE